MHTISESEGARLMAHWRASGGAMDAPAGREAAGDDGLQAAMATMPSFTHPCFGIDPGDDGLQAGRVTGLHIPGTCGGDGLAL
jgi:hypothetical protein